MKQKYALENDKDLFPKPIDKHTNFVPNINNKLVTLEDIRQILEPYQIDMKPTHLKYYQLAFVHKSMCLPCLSTYSNDEVIGPMSQSYERLEFLGDSVLGLCISEILYRTFPDADEGFLTKQKTKLVCGEKNAEFSLILGLGQFILLSGHVEAFTDGRRNRDTLNNVFESFIGALFLDASDQHLDALGVIRSFLEDFLSKKSNLSRLILDEVDYKGRLSIFYQHHFNGIMPSYHIEERYLDYSDQAHFKKTVIIASIDDILVKQKIGVGKGTSQVKAEQDAAQFALQFWGTSI